MEGDQFGAADWMKTVGGVLFFVAGLLTWWDLEFGRGLSVSYNAFDYNLTGVLPYVIFVGIGVLTIVERTESLRLPEALVHPLLVLFAAGIGTVLVGYRFFDGGESGLPFTRGAGLYLAVAAALLVLAGCVIAFREYRASPAEPEEYDEYSPSEDATPRRFEHPPLP
jgi:hypothetical protein